MLQAIKVKYFGPTNTKGSRYIARCYGGKIVSAIDHSLDNDRNAENTAMLLAMKMHWIDTAKSLKEIQSDFRRQYVAGVFDNDYYFVDKKGGSLRHVARVEFEIQGLYSGKWEAVTACDTLKEAKQALRDYDLNETQYPHRIRRVKL